MRIMACISVSLCSAGSIYGFRAVGLDTFAVSEAEEAKKTLQKLGIQIPKPAVAKIPPQYDRLVLLILESMHRDYINYYNENIRKRRRPISIS